MEQNTIVRPANDSDADEISKLVQKTIRISNARDYSDAVIERLVANFATAAIQSLLKRRIVLVATQNEVIVGTASFDGNEVRTVFVVIAIASAHHRLNYIHPFPDGNGRVSRLMSHAMALRAGIGGQGLWSISRGLARGIEDRGDYKRMMDYADTPCQGDRDGRGNLSEQALHSFCRWFLQVMLDQIQFSARMFDLAGLEKRYLRLIADAVEDKRAPTLMAAVLRYGSLERGDAEIVLKTSERTARNTLSDLVRVGFLKSNSPKTPVRIAFPLEYRERLFPNLFADAPVA